MSTGISVSWKIAVIPEDAKKKEDKKITIQISLETRVMTPSGGAISDKEPSSTATRALFAPVQHPLQATLPNYGLHNYTKALLGPNLHFPFRGARNF